MSKPPVPITDELSAILFAAVKVTFPDSVFDVSPNVKMCDNPKFGDYQSEFALSIAKRIGKNPMDIALAMAEKLSANSCFSSVHAVKPGFINITLADAYLEKKGLELIVNSSRSCCEIFSGKTIVIDYSSPNVAKSMHIGHFRATIIGNVINNILRYCGATVIADNHIGDYGTQFGKLIVAYRKWVDIKNYSESPIAELERLYVKFQSEANAEMENHARAELVKLQQGDEENRKLWNEFVNRSMAEFNRIYERLSVTFDTVNGESFYQPWLSTVVQELVDKKIAHEDNGAIIVDTEARYGIKGPILIKKSDGGFIYATTDLAAILYRKREYNPSRIVYVTDARQQDHFKSIFAIADEWLSGNNIEKIHVWFGSIKGKDGRPFSTREGNAVGLEGILNEAVERARAVVETKNPSLPESEKETIAETVGIASLKYSEINHDLKSDTVFDWDRMLALEGNTAPYQLYTHARIRSVLRKCEEIYGAMSSRPEIKIQLPVERNIIKLVDLFANQVKSAARELKPNFITEFLNKISGEFNFYYNLREAPVIKETNTAIRESRVALYKLTGDTIKSALSLLGINALERM